MKFSLPVLVLFFTFFMNKISCNDFYNLTIIHFNDFHARYEPITNLSTTCKGQNCIGGFSRLYRKINQLLETSPNPILLNAGDNFKGTLWYMVHRWNVTQHFLNKLKFDAITLGNHEFDDGIQGLVPFLKTIKSPMIVSNIDDSQEPTMQNLYKKSVVVEKNGKRIGIIGVVTTTTPQFSHTGKLNFLDESESVNAAAAQLTKNVIFTNIVLSHCGYQADLDMAKKSKSKISIIVGGHTDTFLYTGSPVPGPDKPSGPYPTLVTNQNGEQVLVVQASAYTKYLGNLNVVFDNTGKIVEWGGNPIFLSNEIPTDPQIDQDLEVWKQAVDLEGNKVVGETLLAMPNQICRAQECELGNFVTDAMVYSYVDKGEGDDWTYASIAMIHAGGMRAGIDPGNITFNQLSTTFPFEDTIDVFDIKGQHLVEILESCMDDKHLKSPHLFQVSGLRVVFNISHPEGQRIQSLKVRSRENKDKYENIELEKDYRIILPTFLSTSGFNQLILKYIKNKRVGDLDLSVYSNYLEKNRPLEQKIEGRVKIIIT